MRVGNVYKGEWNKYPPRKIYWGKMRLSGEVFLGIGAFWFFFNWQTMVNKGHWHKLDARNGSFYNMDNLIIVDGEYRYIPTRTMPKDDSPNERGAHAMDLMNWTPTDGKW